jgi:hypothetical protein
LSSSARFPYDEKEIRGGHNVKKKIVQLLLIVFFYSLKASPVTFITESMLRKASKELTQDEADRIKRYIREGIRNAKLEGNIPKQRQFEELANEFYRAHYGVVLQGLRVQGADTPTLLRMSFLRDYFISGQLEDTPLLVREIASIDWLFVQDTKATKKQWPELKDKVLYIIDLTNQLCQKHELIKSVQILEWVIDDLRLRLEDAKITMASTLGNQMAEAIQKLNALFRCRITDKEIQCIPYLNNLK